MLTHGIHPMASLYDALSSLQFLNAGTTLATDQFFWENIRPVGESQVMVYLEADNVSCVECAWPDGGRYFVAHPYLWKKNTSGMTAVPPKFTPLSPYDWTAAPIVKVGTTNIQPSEAACEASCASIANCNVGLWLSGTVRHGECWLSEGTAAAPKNDFCGAKPGQVCESFIRAGAPAPGGWYSGVAPASGIRSAVPLGGISAGSFELRGDGTLHEFIIHNAGPSGAAKIQVYEDAHFAVSVDGVATVLQTHPRASAAAANVSGVDAIEYAGAYPVSRLSASVADDLTTELYAWSAFAPGDMPRSARPAVAFTLAAKNHGGAAKNVSMMFNLPFLLEADQLRKGAPLTGVAPAAAADAAACLARCAAAAPCASWVWIEATTVCQLQSNAPLNVYAKGVTSGIAGSWVHDAASQCLVLQRPGMGPMHGNVSLCASASAAASSWSAATDSSAAELLADFARGNGRFSAHEMAATASAVGDAHGAVSVSALIAAGQSTTLSLTLGWFFPEKDHYNYNADPAWRSTFGNQYTVMYPGGAVAAAWGDTASGAPREAALASSVATISAWHTPFFNSSMPAWLGDILVNSVSHVRDAMWWRECAGCHVSTDSRVDAEWGVWRQFEANDCPDIDSIHNDGERHIPYIMMMTDGTRSKLSAWAGNQFPPGSKSGIYDTSGMLAEQILNAHPDAPQGRVMADSTAMFIVYVLELFKWAGDAVPMNEYWEVIKTAAGWMNQTATQYGVPYRLQTTYDVINFPQYELSAYASAFHILGLKAAKFMADAMGPTEAAFAAELDFQIKRAQTAMDVLQWNASAGYYNAGSDECAPGVGCKLGTGTFADAFYAQTLAYSAGLGELLAKPERLDSHLAYTQTATCVHNNVSDPTQPLIPGCPQGLVIIVDRPVDKTDLQVWEMATYDHVAMQLQRAGKVGGAAGVAAAAAALEFAKGPGVNYAQVVNDQWATAGAKFNDGNPSITTHYGYHMTVWHLMFGLSGQLADFSAPSANVLTFAPVLFPTGACGFSYPVLLPDGNVGSIACVAGNYELTFTLVNPKSSWLHLTTLSVHGVAYPATIPVVAANTPIVWSAGALKE